MTCSAASRRWPPGSGPVMPEPSSAEWAEAVGGLWGDLPEAPGANGTVSLAIATAPRREVAVHWRYEDGRPVAGGAGAGEAALSLTLAAADALDVMSGRVEPSVAFMRGRLKAAGAGALLLAFLASTTSPGFAAWCSKAQAVGPLPH
jgi:hypothetical protein